MIGERSFDELKCLKRELKAWESMFERKHSRRPSKDDVDSAPEEIKETYKRYHKLRKGAERKQKSPEQEEDDEVFGKRLNKSENPASVNRSVRIQMSPNNFKPIKLCHGQRPKKLCLKNLEEEPVEKDKICKNMNVNLSSSVNNGSDDEDFKEDHDLNNDLGFSITCTSGKRAGLSRPGMMLGKSKVTQRMSRRSALASDWLEKIKSELSESVQSEPDKALKTSSFDDTSEAEDLTASGIGSESTMVSCQDEEQEPVIENSTVKEKTSGRRTIPVKTNAQINGSQSVSLKKNPGCMSPEIDHNQENRLQEAATKCLVEPAESDRGVTDGKKELCESVIDASSNEEVPVMKNCPTVSVNRSVSRRFSSEKSRFAENRHEKERDDLVEPLHSGEDRFDSRLDHCDLDHVSSGGQKPVVNESSSVNDLPASVSSCATVKKAFTSDHRPFSPEECDPSGKLRGGSVSKRKRIDDECVTEGEVSQDFDTIVSEKRSKIRRTHNPDNTDEESTKEDETTEKRPAKRSSGLVSENFRALNMKVRKFSRRGHGTSYGAYKRKMWKQKQQQKEQGEKKEVRWKKTKMKTKARTSTNSSTTCFKCGEDGHWMKDCPRNKTQAKTVTENWSEPIKAPADLDIGDEEWDATEDRLKNLLNDRVPRLYSAPCNTPPAMEPLYEPENGKPIGTPEEVFDALNKLGFDSFRPGQEEAIMQVLSGLSTLVVLSTGAGKSLCYQLPAYMYNKRSPCLTLVISPLVSLMEDQVVGLPFGLCGVSLNTNMTKPQREKAVGQITSGKAAVVLVSPEALVGGSTGSGCLPHPSRLPPIAFACIDEAHCLSEWSHNFRPSYLRVCKVLRERFGVQCFLGLTATATRSTAISVAEHLGIAHRPDAIIRGATIPPNLNLSVSCDSNRDRAILELLQGSRFSDCDSIIIYCTRREQTDRLATLLRTCLQKNPMNTSSCITERNGEDLEEESETKKRGKKRKTVATKSKSTKKAVLWQAECYHAGMSAAQRRRVQKKFMSGELRIVVATVAFGMGLDKANVRAIIHYNLPKSFESYVQEIGRAGRDGLSSHCHVFIDPEGKDVRELRRHAYASTVDRTVIKKLVSQVFPKCDCKALEAKMRAKRQEGLGMRTGEGNGSVGSVGRTDGSAGLGEPGTEDFDWADDAEILDHLMEFDGGEKDNEGLDRMEVAQREKDSEDGASATSATTEDRTSVDCDENDCLTTVDHPSITCASAAPENNPQDLSPSKVKSKLHKHCDVNPRCACVCGGHEVALPIEKAVQELDMKEEGIATLLCYLELHANQWVNILQPVRSTCTLKFYGGPAQLHFVAQKVPLVTAAIAYARKRQEFKRNTGTLTFPVVEIVDKMGWDVEPARRELYALQWNDSLRLAGESGLSAGHSGILVEFTDLAFHLRVPGDLSDDERDKICDFLEDRILAQERSQLGQLHGVWSTFMARAHSNCWQSAEECDKKVDEELKAVVKAYFESRNDPTKAELETLVEARKNSQFIDSNVPSEEPVNWDAVSRDIRAFLSLHGDCVPSGRAIARIFHGIDSPCFPAAVWGRERRFWRRHLDVDFNLLRKFAIKELVKFR